MGYLPLGIKHTSLLCLPQRLLSQLCSLFSSFLLNHHLLFEITNAGCQWLFYYPLHFSPSWKIFLLKDMKVAAMGLFLPCEILCLLQRLPISLWIPLCHVRVGLESGCSTPQRLFRILSTHLLYIVLVWSMTLRDLWYFPELCSVNSWKFLCLSFIVINFWRL